VSADGVCSACGADVVFVRSETSKATMILDVKTEKHVLLLDYGKPAYSIDAVRQALEAGLATARVTSVFTDHHATCPHADQFRRST